MGVAETPFDRAFRLSDEGNHAAALEIWNTLIRDDQNNASIWYNRGVCLFRLERFQEAVNSFSQAAAIDPFFTDALFNKGIALVAQEKYDDAIRVFDKILKQNPKDKKACEARRQAQGKIIAKFLPRPTYSTTQTRLVK